MNAFVGLALVLSLGVVPYYLYRGWKYGDPILPETSAYGTARAESRPDSHLDLVPESECDHEVRCLRCGTPNQRTFSFCRRCETPLC